MSLLVFDALLLFSIVSLAWATLTSSDERLSVILFMAFGLVLAVAWGRLLAPDVALAEAAIGAGLTGALLLAAVRGQPCSLSPGATHAPRKQGAAGVTVVLRLAVTLLSAALAGTLAWALLHAFSSSPHDLLPRAISENLAASGVSNPVTAVLLNFRAYDTLLELAVLLTTVLGIFALDQATPGYQPAGPIFDGLVRWLVPVLILTAGYLLWVGAHAPGGAFQAGATLAAAGVVLRLAALEQARVELQSLNDAKDKFLSNLGREVSTSLAQIAETSTTLRESARTPCEPGSGIDQHLADVNRSARDVLHLLETILEWPRLQTGQKLDLLSTRISDRELGNLLSSLNDLRFLSLAETRVGDAGLVHLQSLTHLQELHLDHSEITDEGLKILSTLPDLEILDLKGTRITDAGLAEVGRLERLKGLYLTRTGITDAGLVHLRNLSKLETLILWDTVI